MYGKMSKNQDAASYYREVADYYNQDADDFEQRYQENPVLKRLRTEFRTVTEQYLFKNALEVGSGPGFDVTWFGSRYPDRSFHALDISPEMIALSKKNVQRFKLKNVHHAVGSVEDIPVVYPGRRFDMIYIYFGALNTVYDLKKAAHCLKQISAPQATLVLTVVNRYYLTEIPLWLAKGKFRKAFERVLGTWHGYSDIVKIPSRCLSARDIKKAFGTEFDRLERQGFCIFYPAWYRAHLLQRLKKKAEILWKADLAINRTPFWNMGEYSLYVFRSR